MSSDVSRGSGTTILKEDIPGRVHEALVNQFGEGQKKRVRGFFVSPSLRKIMEFVDPDEIHSIKAERRVSQSTNTVPLSGEIAEYTDVEASQKIRAQLAYQRDAHHTTFDWNGLKDWLDEQPAVHDFCVSELVLRLDNKALREQLYDILHESTGFSDKGELLSPFFAVMQSRSPGEPKARRAVKEYHEPYYFKSADQCDGEQRGMNWPIRTMDLVALWSLRAWTDSGNTPLYNLTMHDIEDLAVNHVGSSSPEYGAINSKLVVNKWRSKFSRGTTDIKSWEWQKHEGWVRVGTEDTR